MAKSLHYTEADGITTAANTTEFWMIFGSAKKNTTEANVEMIMRTAGTISNLQISIYSNSISGGTSNIKVRKNGADTSLAVAVGASATGIFEDNTNTVSIVAGDKVCITTVPGAATGTMGFSFFASIFTPTVTTETVTKMAAIADFANTNGIDHTTASATRFYPINAYMRTNSSTESVLKTRQRLPGKFRNLAVRVRTNTRTTDTVIKFRKNGADGVQSITVAASATGWFEDTTNQDIVGLNDDVTYSVTTGTDSGSFVVDSISSEYVNTSGFGQLVNSTYDASSTGDQVNINQNRNIAVAGGLFGVSGSVYTEIAWKAVSGAEFQFSDIGLSIHTNTIDTNSFLKLRVNNADTTLIVTVPPNTTGAFTNAIDLHQVSVGDLVNLRLSTGSGSGNMNFGTSTIYINDLTTTSVMNAECDVSNMATDGEFTVNFTTADDIPRHTVWLALSA